MDAPVDFSLDRARILNGNLASSSLGSYSGGNYTEGGHVSSLSRNVASSLSGAGGLGGAGSLQDLARGGTPATLSQAELQNRYLHSSLPLSSQGANYAAMMSSYLNGSGSGSDHLKTLMPELEQYYRTHGEGLPRYMLNSSGLFPPYFPYLPGAAESLSLFAQNSTPTAAAYHRMYELHKEAVLYHELSAGRYGSISPGLTSAQPSRITTTDYSTSSKETSASSRQNESKRTLDLSKDSRHSDSKRSLDLSKQCDTKKSSELSKHNDSKRSVDLSKQSEAKTTESKDHTLNKRVTEPRRQPNTKRYTDSSKSNDSKQSAKRKDVEKDESANSERKSQEKNTKAGAETTISPPSRVTSDDASKTDAAKIGSSEKSSPERNQSSPEASKHAADSDTINDSCPVKKKKPKIDKILENVERNEQTEKAKIRMSLNGSPENGGSHQISPTIRISISDESVHLHSPKSGTTPESSSSTNGGDDPGNENPTTTTTISVPYYHSIYSHSISNGVTDRMKIRAPTFTPEIVTLPSVVSIASLPVQTMACDMSIKKDTSAYSVPKLSPPSTVHGGKCQMSPRSNESSKVSDIPPDPLALTTKETKHKEKKDLKHEKSFSPKERGSSSKHSPNCSSKSSSRTVSPEGRNILSGGETDEESKKLYISVEEEGKSKPLTSLISPKTSPRADKLHSPQNLKQKEKNGAESTTKTKEEKTTSNPNPILYDNKKFDKQDSQTKAMNLSKQKTNTAEKKSDNLQEKESKRNGDSVGERHMYRKSEFPIVKRRADKILTKENKDLQRRDEGSSSGMSNIPVGIAVAQKREEAKPGQSESTCTGGTSLRGPVSSSVDNDVSVGRLLAVNVGSTCKTSVSAAPTSDLRNQLPANLIVTGSANGSGVAWADDPSARQFSSPWIQPAHALNASQWLGPISLTMNPSSMDTGQLPFHVPPGYKLVQDSVTGQLIFLPSTNFDMYDPNRLWNFPAGHPTQFQQMIAAHQSSTLQHPIYSQDRPSSDYPVPLPQFQQFPPMACTSPVDIKPIPLLHQKNIEKISTEHHKKDMKESTTPQLSVTTAEKSKEDAQVQHSSAESETTGISNVQQGTDNLSVNITSNKSDSSTVQSRGTSPMVPASDCEDNSQEVIEDHNKEDLSSEAADSSPKSDHSVASVQTESVKKSCCDSNIQATEEIPADDVLRDSEKQTGTTKAEEPVVSVKKICDLGELPRTTVIDNVTIVEMSAPKSVVSKEDVKSSTEQQINTGYEVDKKEEPSVVCEETKRSSEAAYVNYNPFLDPQILQAADGLELLSALAEQRSKCMTEVEKQNSAENSEKESENKQENTKLFNEPKEIPKDTKTIVAQKQKRKPSISRTRSIPPSKPTKVESGSYYTSTGLRIPQGDEEINAIELDMRIRLAELQRQYKEKQKQLAKLQPKKDKSKDKEKEKEDSSKQKGPGRPRKRKHNSSSSQESSPTTTVTSTPSKTPVKRGKEAQIKKKKPAEELVDRVFRKTGGGFGMPLSKKLKANAMAALFKTQSGFTMKRKGSSSGNSAIKTGKEPSFGKSSVLKSPVHKSIESKVKSKHFKYEEDSSRKNLSSKGKNLFETFTSSLPKGAKVSNGEEGFKKTKTQNGLGILARFAASEFCGGSSHKKSKKKQQEEEEECKDGDKDSECFINSNENDPLPSFNTNHHTQIITKRDSDLESSQDSSTSGHKKRKPGRPRKFTPDETKNGTETIVDKHSKNFRLYQLQNFNEQWNNTPSPPPPPEKKQKVEPSQPINKPLFLDEEWMLRRSERIFLSDPSPQPSPNFSTTSTSSTKSRQSSTSSSTKKKSEDAKLQKAKNIHELSQKVKKKYSSVKLKRSKSSDNSQHIKKLKHKVPISKEIIESESESSESDADNIPLSELRERPATPEPRSCSMSVDELKDGLRVLVFRDGLFYEGAVKGIRPPDVYGVFVDNARGNRPYIYSREEILRDVIVDVRPCSSRFLKEGTRLCAYWSQQFSCLYPGTVAKASPNPHNDKSLINVEFDDGDSGRIPLDHIRLLPQDFPLVSYDPNPLLLIGKRRRHTTSDLSEQKHTESSENVDSKTKTKRGPGRPPKTKMEDNRGKDDDDEDIDVCGLDEEGDDVFPEKNIDNQKYEHSSKHSKSSKDSEKKKSKQKQREREYRSSDSDQDQGNKTKQNSFGLFKVPKIKSAPKIKSRRPKYLCGEGHVFSNEGYSDCRLHDQIPPLDDDDDDSDGFFVDESPSKSAFKNKSPLTYESKTAAFIPARQFWEWSGKSTKRPGMKGKAKKEFYRSIVRGDEYLSIGDCAVFLSSGRPNLPFVGRIDSMWEAWGGQMVVKVKWFYHPEETKGGKKLQDMKGALFQSPHIDENDVQTISHKCELLSYAEYRKRRSLGTLAGETDVYYLAGTYEPTIGLLKFEDGIM